ncbi:MAG TPA: hypothetical protein VGP87_09605 [Gemmatimonadales bacterium]|jgi:hypothetical protein|nr:hypothetical protein [Gemmatimonadales bacterium]
MRTPPARLVTACAILLAFAPVRTVLAQDDRPAAGRWLCFSAFESDPIYVTSAWDGTAAMAEVRSAFSQMLASRYGYKDRISCSRANIASSTLAGVEAGRKARDAQWEKSGKKIVQTGWTFGSPDAAAAAPPANPPSPAPAPAASAQPAQWAVCRMTTGPNGAKKNYVSGVMALPGTIDKDSLAKRFAGFLRTMYKVIQRTAQCGTSPSETGATAQLKAWIDAAARHRATYGPTTDTHWVMTPGSQ